MSVKNIENDESRSGLDGLSPCAVLYVWCGSAAFDFVEAVIRNINLVTAFIFVDQFLHFSLLTY